MPTLNVTLNNKTYAVHVPDEMLAGADDSRDGGGRAAPGDGRDAGGRATPGAVAGTAAEEFFQKMDRDMNQGWQMSRDFIENPDRTQRAQIAAHRLMLAMSAGKETLIMLMAGYILKRLPGVTGVVVDTDGEMLNTEIIFGEAKGAAPAPSVGVASKTGSGGMNKIEAMKQAGKEVTAVYKVGKSFRYAVLNSATGQWIESPAMDDEKEAQELRMRAFRQRFEELASPSG
ncbi:MAG: hypothetical protein HY083_00220 [Gammaproteobacteria bacterium]|nr:hypothetical protein [Gammaproteobacteria bacterium]